MDMPQFDWMDAARARRLKVTVILLTLMLAWSILRFLAGSLEAGIETGFPSDDPGRMRRRLVVFRRLMWLCIGLGGLVILWSLVR